MGSTTRWPARWRRRMAPRRRTRGACIEQLEPRTLLAFSPTGLEQELFQLINRFRADPQGELSRLLSSTTPPTSTDALIQSQLEYWRVNGNVLRSQWADLAPVPPLAWSEPLTNAARAHNLAMYRHDSQRHRLPGELDPGARLTAAGYDWQRWGENIYAYPRTVLEAHAGFVIDWGPGQGGIQNPPDHRLRMLRDDYVHVGVAVSEVGTTPGRSVGPLVVTQDFAAPLETTLAYVVGAVYRSSNNSPWYVAGSGYGGVKVVFEGTGGTFETTSWGSGGYQVQLPPGTYRARVVGGKLPAPLVNHEIVVGDRNVAVDFVYPTDRARTPVANDDVYVIASGSTAVLAVLSNDRDPDGSLLPGSLSVVVQPGVGRAEVDPATGSVLYSTDGLWQGLDTFRYVVRDDDGFLSNRATVRVVAIDPLDRPWQNPANPLDVNVDEQVTPADALQLINALAAGRAGPLPAPFNSTRHAPSLYDVNGDGVLSARDALIIINHLNVPDAAESERGGEWSDDAEPEDGEGWSPAPIGPMLLAGAPSPAGVNRAGESTAGRWLADAPAETASDQLSFSDRLPPALVAQHPSDAVLPRRTPPIRARHVELLPPDEAHDACFRDWALPLPQAWFTG